MISWRISHLILEGFKPADKAVPLIMLFLVSFYILPLKLDSFSGFWVLMNLVVDLCFEESECLAPVFVSMLSSFFQPLVGFFIINHLNYLPVVSILWWILLCYVLPLFFSNAYWYFRHSLSSSSFGTTLLKLNALGFVQDNDFDTNQASSTFVLAVIQSLRIRLDGEISVHCEEFPGLHRLPFLPLSTFQIIYQLHTR